MTAVSSAPSMTARDACYQWLLSAVRDWLHERTGQARRAVPVAAPATLDWTTLEAMARHQSVEPILHVLLTRDPSRSLEIPGHLRDRWMLAYHATRFRNREILAVLTAIVDRCETSGIPIVALKGPVRAVQVFGDVGLRPMADLDVLCRTRDLVVLREIVAALGFDTVGAPIFHELAFYSEARQLSLEVHFDLHHPIRGRSRFLHGAWSDRTTMAIEGASVPVLSAEHDLVFELGHCAWHGFALDLRHMIGFAGMLAPGSASLDRARLIRLLDETGLARAHGQFARALASVLELDLGRWPASGAAPDEDAAFRHHVLNGSAAIGYGPDRGVGFSFLAEPGLGRKAVFAWRRFVPPLGALQAAYDVRSPLLALACLPRHVSRAAIELAGRALTGLFRSGPSGSVPGTDTSRRPDATSL